jgi:hypothetical protein
VEEDLTKFKKCGIIWEDKKRTKTQKGGRLWSKKKK